MGRRTKSNVPQDVPLKWNVEKAAAEFGLSIMTLRKALNRDSAKSDADGLFSTQQIVAALYGALHQEKVRTQKELADRYTLENQITRADVLRRSEVERVFAAIADAIRTQIMSSHLDRREKDDILNDIAALPIVLKEVACANPTRAR